MRSAPYAARDLGVLTACRTGELVAHIANSGLHTDISSLGLRGPAQFRLLPTHPEFNVGAMNVTVYVPPALRRYCDGEARLKLAASDVRLSLTELEQRYPSLYRSVCDETGSIRRHVNIFVNSTNVRGADGLDTLLESGDEITILHAVSGG